MGRKSHRPGALFPVGDTEVSYVFSDSAGNQAECTFTVTGMYFLLDPRGVLKFDFGRDVDHVLLEI